MLQFNKLEGRPLEEQQLLLYRKWYSAKKEGVIARNI